MTRCNYTWLHRGMWHVCNYAALPDKGYRCRLHLGLEAGLEDHA